jgi:photosystem II stability/assembly factor-like uncharacterized protein
VSKECFRTLMVQKIPMRKIFFFATLALLFGCKAAYDAVAPVKVEVILEKSGPVRALEVDGDKIWYGGLERFGWVNVKTKESKTWEFNAPSKPDFRSIGQTDTHVFLLNAGSPAWLLRIDKTSQKIDTVYTDNRPEVFFDSMKFSDNLNGMALGDPMDGRFTLLKTTDGGKTWDLVDSLQSPVAREGEGAFAASNTNLLRLGYVPAFVSGGKASRFFRRESGIWNSYETPIQSGESMTGIFTADFYDDSIGFIAGGNYEDPKDNNANKALSVDGGKTWRLVADGQGFGYASCVQFFPGSNGRKLACVGATGLWISNNAGEIWRKIHDNAGWYTIRFIGPRKAVVAGRFEITLLEF